MQAAVDDRHGRQVTYILGGNLTVMTLSSDLAFELSPAIIHAYDGDQ